MTSIRRGLAFLLTAATVPSIALIGVLLYVFVRGALIERFDDGLLARARSLAGMVHAYDGRIEFVFVGEAMPEYEAAPGRGPGDFFELWTLDVTGHRRLLERSHSLGDVQLAAATPGGRPAVWSGAVVDRRVRVTMLRFQPFAEDRDEQGHEESEPPLASHVDDVPEVLLLVARSRVELDRTLNLFSAALLVSGAILAAGTVLVVLAALARGLRPVARLADQLNSVDPGKPSARLAVEGVPSELRPIADRTNQLLERVATAVEHERRLASSAAHELRTPLAEIRVAAELALSRPRSGAEYRRALDDVRDTTLRMEQSVNALLRLARVESGHERPVADVVDLPGILRASWGRWLEPVQRRGICATLDIREPCTLAADRSMVDVILDNLFANAAQYTPQGGEITVTLERADGTASLLSIRNTAVTADGARGTEHLGIGLALVRSMTRACGGEFETARSEGDFVARLRLPLALM